MSEETDRIERMAREWSNEEWIEFLAHCEEDTKAPVEDRAVARRFRERIADGSPRALQILRYYRSGGLRSYEALQIGGVLRREDA